MGTGWGERLRSVGKKLQGILVLDDLGGTFCRVEITSSAYLAEIWGNKRISCRDEAILSAHLTKAR
jgi:hypothetical protein